MEHPDSDAGKPLAGLARSFGNALRPALRKAGWLAREDDASKPRLHVIFLDGDHVVLAHSEPRDSSPWLFGIPRLRMHADAPSRSALKLEEALLTLLSDDERKRLLRDGMRGADLGAAPGGWTWVLVRNGLHVTAIDNGPLAPALARQRPRRPPARGRLPLAAEGVRWTGWSATWSSNRGEWPNAWRPGCAKAGAGTRSSISSCR